MSSMTNITVKNAAGLDVVYNAATPSAGDKSPAIWRQNAAHANIGFRPTFKLLTRDNARANGRVVDASFIFPIIASIGGVDTLVAKVPFSVSGTLPTNVAASAVFDGFVQFGNLIVSELIRQAAEEGYAPT